LGCCRDRLLYVLLLQWLKVWLLLLLPLQLLQLLVLLLPLLRGLTSQHVDLQQGNLWSASCH
jgi:hypothetical protein